MAFSLSWAKIGAPAPVYTPSALWPQKTTSTSDTNGIPDRDIEHEDTKPNFLILDNKQEHQTNEYECAECINKSIELATLELENKELKQKLRYYCDIDENY